MEYKSIKGYTGWGQLAILMVFLGVGFVLTAVIQIVIGMMMVPAGTTFEQLPNVLLQEMSKPENVGYTRIIQIAGTFCLMFVPAIIFNRLVNGKKMWWLGFNGFLNIRQVGIGFMLIFSANLLAQPFSELSQSVISHFPSLNNYAASLEAEYNKQVALLSNLRSWSEYIVAIMIIAFLPALFEEVFFRGAFQNLLVKWWKSAFWGILASAIIFSLIHFSIYLFLSRLILGFVLGLMFYQTKNLWVNIIAHFLNNLIAISQMFYLGRDGGQIDLHKMDPNINWWGGILALVLIIILWRALIKFSKINVALIQQKESKLEAMKGVQSPFL